MIGQAAFGAETYKRLRADGHDIVGVFTIPDSNRGADPLAEAAAADGVAVHKVTRWRALKKDGGQVVPEVLASYKAAGADLNVLAFVTAFIPMEVIDGCRHGSLIYHPSLLPRHRGASAINHAIMQGDTDGGLTVFWGDDGYDTGPICVQRKTTIGPQETMIDLYKRFMFPEGVDAVSEACKLVAQGTTPRLPQDHSLATEEGLCQKPVRVDFSADAQTVHNTIRGCDRAPGAYIDELNGHKQVTLMGSCFPAPESDSKGKPIDAATCSQATVRSDGIAFTCGDGQAVLVTKLLVGKDRVDAKDILNASPPAPTVASATPTTTA